MRTVANIIRLSAECVAMKVATYWAENDLPGTQVLIEKAAPYFTRRAREVYEQHLHSTKQCDCQ